MSFATPGKQGVNDNSRMQPDMTSFVSKGEGHKNKVHGRRAATSPLAGTPNNTKSLSPLGKRASKKHY